MLNGTRFRIDREIAAQGQLTARIARAQSDIATGKRMQIGSDDPAAAAQVSVLRREGTNLAQWRAAADAGAATAARADSLLAGTSSILDRVRELVTTAANATMSSADRATAAAEMNGLADEIDTLAAATDVNGSDVFASGSALRIPMGRGLTLTASTTRSDAFIITTASGSADIATLVRSAAAALNSGPAARAGAISDVVAASDHISAIRGEQGARGARIDALRDRLGDSASTNAETRAALEQTDIAATVAHLQADQLSLEAAQAAFAKIHRRTLFDLIA